MDLKIMTAVATLFLFCSFSALMVEGKGIKICHVDNKWTKFDAKQQSCCGGRLERRDRQKRCCRGAGKFYFPEYTLCCGKDICDRFEDNVERTGERACCGGQIINVNTHTCCNKRPHELPADGVEHMMCCGKDLVNRTTTMCCQNEDDPSLVRKHARLPNYSCCDHIPLDLTKEKCASVNGIQQVISVNEDSCEGQIINLRQKTCCNGKIYNAPKKNPENLNQLNPRVACCGTNGYDPTTHECCPHYSLLGHVIPKHNELRCCKNAPHGYINSTYQMCCDGRTLTRTSKHNECCGTHQINPTSQGCCNHQPYDKKTHFCCRGFPSGILEKGKTCCGGKELGKDNLCCDNTYQVARINSTDDKCCLNYNYTYVPYTSSKMDCHVGQLETRSSPDDDVCADTRYLRSDAVCCNGEVHNFPKGDTLGCCRGPELTEVPYSENHQICCSGVVHNMSVNEAECCKDKAYSKMNAEKNPCLEKCGDSYHYKEETVCCGREIFVKEKDGDGCCGNKAYSTQTQTCCQAEIHNSTEGQCCGSDLYDSDTHRCCGGYEVIKRKSKTEKCCMDVLAYNKRLGRCKGNGLVEPKKKITAVKNICKQKTWKDLSGIEVEICGRTLAIQCTLLKKRYNRTTKEFEFTMKCQNLALPYVNDYYKPSAMQRNSKLKVKISSNRLKCRVKKNQKVIIFLDKQPTAIRKKKPQYELKITDDDAFKLISETKAVWQMIDKVSSERFCQRIFNYMTEDELFEYFKIRW